MILNISEKTNASNRRVCKVLGLPRSSFFEASTETSRQISGREIGDQIEAIFIGHKGRYGYRRITEEFTLPAERKHKDLHSFFVVEGRPLPMLWSVRFQRIPERAEAQ